MMDFRRFLSRLPLTSPMPASQLRSSDENSPALAWVDLWLRLVVALECLGLVRETQIANSKFFSLLISPVDVGGFGWSQASVTVVDTTLAVSLTAAAALVVIRPFRAVLAFVAICHLAIPAISTWLGGERFTQLSVASHAVRYAAPIALMWIGPWSKRKPISLKAINRIDWMLRIAAALTFAAHGWKAYKLYPTYVDYILAAGWNLLGVDLAQSSAEHLLRWIGVLDIIVAVLIVVTRWQVVALWMAFWGFVTAGSRIVDAMGIGPLGIVDGWNSAGHLFLVRAANGGVPLAIFLIGIARLQSAAQSEVTSGSDS